MPSEDVKVRDRETESRIPREYDFSLRGRESAPAREVSFETTECDRRPVHWIIWTIRSPRSCAFRPAMFAHSACTSPNDRSDETLYRVRGQSSSDGRSARFGGGGESTTAV